MAALIVSPSRMVNEELQGGPVEVGKNQAASERDYPHNTATVALSKANR